MSKEVEDTTHGEWFNGSILRHPKIPHKKLESTAATLPRGFNKVITSNFFSLL
jgi:hypothetical protein